MNSLMSSGGSEVFAGGAIDHGQAAPSGGLPVVVCDEQAMAVSADDGENNEPGSVLLQEHYNERGLHFAFDEVRPPSSDVEMSGE